MCSFLISQFTIFTPSIYFSATMLSWTWRFLLFSIIITTVLPCHNEERTSSLGGIHVTNFGIYYWKCSEVGLSWDPPGTDTMSNGYLH